MSVIRKVNSKIKPAVKKTEEAPIEQPEVSTTQERRSSQSTESRGQFLQRGVDRVKKCQFCVHKTEPYYWDSSSLRRFLNDRGRIVSRGRTGACAKHQRRVSKQIKYARHLSLMPFMIRV